MQACLLQTGGLGGKTTTSSGGSGGETGTGGMTASSGGSGGTGGSGGKTSSSSGTGGATTSSGSGGTGGSGGSTSSSGGGGTGGSGGGDPCMDQPANNALTIGCNSGCDKVLIYSPSSGTDIAESSANDDLCEMLPFETHPNAGEYALVWVFDPANNNAIQATSLGSFPSKCSVKCGPVPNPGPAPDHTQMETQLLNGGYAPVSCGVMPTVSIASPCANGMYALLEY